MLGCGLFLVATTATRCQVRHFCGVGFVSSFLFPSITSTLATAMGRVAEATLGGGTACSLQGTQRSRATPHPRPAGMAQCLAA